MRLLRDLIHDEAGGEVLEYALVAGLIVLASITLILSFGQKVFARWQTVDTGIQ